MLTPKRAKILNFIAKFTADNGRPPLWTEIPGGNTYQMGVLLAEKYVQKVRYHGPTGHWNMVPPPLLNKRGGLSFWSTVQRSVDKLSGQVWREQT
jgi:hypothetical protein